VSDGQLSGAWRGGRENAPLDLDHPLLTEGLCEGGADSAPFGRCGEENVDADAAGKVQSTEKAEVEESTLTLESLELFEQQRRTVRRPRH
jgi:hypothetical protein